MKSTYKSLKTFVFTEADARWVHHPYSDVLVITTRIANSNVLRIGGQWECIIYNLSGCIQKDETQQRWPKSDTTPLYGFTRDHIIPKGMIKLIVTVGEHRLVLTIMTKFLNIDCPSTFNGVIGKSLLKALKVIKRPHHEVPNYQGNWTC